jgi:hypothetical protein
VLREQFRFLPICVHPLTRYALCKRYYVLFHFVIKNKLPW